MTRTLISSPNFGQKQYSVTFKSCKGKSHHWRCIAATVIWILGSIPWNCKISYLIKEATWTKGKAHRFSFNLMEMNLNNFLYHVFWGKSNKSKSYKRQRGTILGYAGQHNHIHNTNLSSEMSLCHTLNLRLLPVNSISSNTESLSCTAYPTKTRKELFDFLFSDVIWESTHKYFLARGPHIITSSLQWQMAFQSEECGEKAPLKGQG